MKMLSFILAFIALSFCFTLIISYTVNCDYSTFTAVPIVLREYIPYFLVSPLALLFGATVWKIRPSMLSDKLEAI